LASSGQRQI